MGRKVIPTKSFEKAIYRLIAKKKIAEDDYESFKKELALNPKAYPLISGTGGIRKTRLSSINKGKSGGFRVCYFYDQECETLFLILIYGKNEQENLTSQEKKNLKELTNIIKGKKHE